MHALEDQFQQLQANVENTLHYASLPTSPAYQGQAGSSAAAQQQAQYPQAEHEHEHEDPAFVAYQAKVRDGLPFGWCTCPRLLAWTLAHPSLQAWAGAASGPDPTSSVAWPLPQVAAATAASASAGDQAFNIGAEGHTKQQQAAYSVPPDECLRQLKQIGYAEADLLTLHPSQQQQLLAQHMEQQQQQEAAPHMPNPTQAHQPKCCVIQ